MRTPSVSKDNTEALDAWLAQVDEPVLEPALPICDPHHHLWDYPHNRYMFEELLADVTSGHNVRATVYMECASMFRAEGPEALKPVGETEFVNGIAAMGASGHYGDVRVCAGIVGYADLTLGSAVGEVLDAHAAVTSRFAGIRHASGWDAADAIRNSHTDPGAGLLADATFRQGFAELGRRGMTFDAWMYHPQIPELTDLARAFPEQVIVFDHFGGPLGIGPYAGQRDAIRAQWQRDVAELAGCDNVVAKLGGLAMPINGFDFHKQAQPPTSAELVAANGDYYEYMIDCFGPQRCMFESNFPVDKASCSYVVLWNAFKRLTADFSATERAQMFHDNAMRVYQVEG